MSADNEKTIAEAIGDGKGGFNVTGDFHPNDLVFNSIYNQAIDHAAETVKALATISLDSKAFFKKFGTYHYPYSEIINKLEELKKPSTT